MATSIFYLLCFRKQKSIFTKHLEASINSSQDFTQCGVCPTTRKWTNKSPDFLWTFFRRLNWNLIEKRWELSLIFSSSSTEQNNSETFPRTFLILSHSNPNFFHLNKQWKFFLLLNRPVLLVTRFGSLSTRDKWFIRANSLWLVFGFRLF